MSSLKKTILSICFLVSTLSAQIDLAVFNKEKLSYDVVWKGLNVAKININVNLAQSDSCKMIVDFSSQTIGWSRTIIEEFDSIYTEINCQNKQLIYSYRMSDWNFLGLNPDITKTYIKKQGKKMFYSYKNMNIKAWEQSVILDKDFSVNDLQEIITESMIMRTNSGNVGDCYYFNILGKMNNHLVPKIFPLFMQNREVINIQGQEYNSIKCFIRIVDTSELFKDPVIYVWVTDDKYHLPLQGELVVFVPIFGEVTIKAILMPSKSNVPYWKQIKK